MTRPAHSRHGHRSGTGPAEYGLGEITAQAYLGRLLASGERRYLGELRTCEAGGRATCWSPRRRRAAGHLRPAGARWPTWPPGRGRDPMPRATRPGPGRGQPRPRLRRPGGRRGTGDVCPPAHMHAAHRSTTLGFIRTPSGTGTRSGLDLSSHLRVDARRQPTQHLGLPHPAQDVCSCSLSPQGNPVRIRNCPATVYACAARARPRSPRTCRQRARPPVRALRRPGLADWAGGRGAACPALARAAPVAPPRGRRPSEGEHHVTIAPADPASAHRGPGSADGPGAALLRTLTELTADLPDTDPGRVAAAALRGRSAARGRGGAARRWPPRRPPG